jgi:hypothetical protein
MKLTKLSLLALLAAASAHADNKTADTKTAAPKAAAPKLDTLVLPVLGLSKDVPPEGTKPPRLVAGFFGGFSDAPGPYAAPDGSEVFAGKLGAKVVGFTSDKKAAWVAADVNLQDARCGGPGKCKPKSQGTAHVTMLVQEGTPWQPLVVHYAQSATAKDAAKNGAPDALTRKVDAGAEDVVKLFESSIGDPAALAATVSSRKDAILYGSAKPERYVGGASMKATLKKWGLGFKARDGIQAGITESKNLAWVAANLDATAVKKADAKATPYRATFIYEKTDKGWNLVVAQFSAFVPTI